MAFLQQMKSVYVGFICNFHTETLVLKHLHIFIQAL